MPGLISLTTADAGVEATVSLLNSLFPPPRPFAVRLWDGTELSVRANACLVLKNPGALRHMLTPPIELSLGEAFIYGDFDIEGDISSVFPALDAVYGRSFSLFDVVGLARQTLSLPGSGSKQRGGRGPVRLQGRVHSRARDRAAIQYHYDVGNDFYELWLDPYMQYSCAYFDTGAEELDTAQERKLEYICRKLRLKPGERVLDIGCGWGGLALYAAQKYGVRVLGITLSQEQAAYANICLARAGLGDRASVKLQDYRDVGVESSDKIVSVGMFEHVGQKQLPEYFAQAYRSLKPGGLFLNHGISQRAPWLHRMNPEVKLCCRPDMRPARVSLWQQWVAQHLLGQGRFIQRYVFPDGELLPVSQVNIVAEQAGFEVRDVENLREHYALTLRHWVDRLETRRTEAIELAGEGVYRTWRLYLAASAYGFTCGRINVNQTLLAKPDVGQNCLPLTREDLYG
ncbi:MAG: putative fatty acid methyltransferase [Anaerolineae bacterium]|nr:putative fatty acid methyltransferase [Anaerolineae bacterium]